MPPQAKPILHVLLVPKEPKALDRSPEQPLTRQLFRRVVIIDHEVLTRQHRYGDVSDQVAPLDAINTRCKKQQKPK